jgi:hypothetical protein
VMPQTYIRTRPGSSGTKSSLRRVSVLWMRSMRAAAVPVGDEVSGGRVARMAG